MIRYSDHQIGDFVLVDGTPRKIEAITKKKIGYHRKENEPRLYYARLRDVEPIEINEYVLRISGFCVDEGKFMTIATFENDKVRIVANKNQREEAWIVSEKNEETLDACIVSLRYVHQLQHAFKLCGIYFEVKL